MRLSEAKRHKHGQMPGDVAKCAKIAMREKKPKYLLHVNEDANRMFRRVYKEKSVTKQRQRDRGVVSHETVCQIDCHCDKHRE